MEYQNGHTQSASAASQPEFTIFTPTFNRAHTLVPLYESITKQTFRDFEWLVVDDGSTDDTSELITRMQAEADFPVRYVRQENAGKHIAINRGVALARGELFLPVDSDDELLPAALETLRDAWLDIPADERPGYTGVTARCIYEDGTLVGLPAKRPVIDCTSAEAAFAENLTSERLGFHRTDVLLAHPFPEHIPAKFIPESRIWLDIARKYRTRFIEAPIRVFHQHPTARLSDLDRIQRAWGDYEVNRFALIHYAGWFPRAPVKVVKLAVGLRRAELHLQVKAERKTFTALGRILLAAIEPLAGVLYARDLLRNFGRIGWRLWVGRYLFFGTAGGRIARLLAGSGSSQADPIKIHVRGVYLLVNMQGEEAPELVYSPRTVQANLLRALENVGSQGARAVFAGRGLTFPGLYFLMRWAGSRAHVVDSSVRQDDTIELARSLELSCLGDGRMTTGGNDPQRLLAFRTCDVLIISMDAPIDERNIRGSIEDLKPQHVIFQGTDLAGAAVQQVLGGKYVASDECPPITSGHRCLAYRCRIPAPPDIDQ